MSVILQRAANRQGGLAAAAAARSAAAEGDGPQLHKNSFKCSKCHRVRFRLHSACACASVWCSDQG